MLDWVTEIGAPYRSINSGSIYILRVYILVCIYKSKYLTIDLKVNKNRTIRRTDTALII